jgi:exodeoxyribonuclease X
MGKILLLDTETCGLTNHPKYGHPQVIELAYYDLTNTNLKTLNLTSLDSVNSYVERFKPSMPIHPQASRVNGIYEKDLLHCRPSEDIDIGEVAYIIGHNPQFDVRCLNIKGVKLICTKELAQLTITGQANNKLTTLIAYLYPEQSEELLKTAHSALQDCKLSFLILLSVLDLLPNVNSFDQLAKLCSQGKKSYEELDKAKPKTKVPVSTMPFGKYKGQLLNEIPTSSLRWYLENCDLQPSLKEAIEALV